MATQTVKSRSSKPRSSKRTHLNINVSLEVDDVVRVAGWHKANHMLNRVLAFAANNKGRISLKVTKPTTKG
jgi:hypothetical protein